MLYLREQQQLARVVATAALGVVIIRIMGVANTAPLRKQPVWRLMDSLLAVVQQMDVYGSEGQATVSSFKIMKITS
ncbi:hypothetical protein A11Q_46 [Pseudobdellovibrio exovorus JSS]|uniref:Uncharacterized protein n=1 Tax=Pseudobdellovibrio exovorus JSS TaxID=1184267 RepID=M4V8D7_9BACT|nr:hypothetical protein A11Q_46 [Pseudobdellovibrio exovorus JSS]